MKSSYNITDFFLEQRDECFENFKFEKYNLLAFGGINNIDSRFFNIYTQILMEKLSFLKEFQYENLILPFKNISNDTLFKLQKEEFKNFTDEIAEDYECIALLNKAKELSYKIIPLRVNSHKYFDSEKINFDYTKEIISLKDVIAKKKSIVLTSNHDLSIKPLLLANGNELETRVSLFNKIIPDKICTFRFISPEKYPIAYDFLHDNNNPIKLYSVPNIVPEYFNDSQEPGAVNADYMLFLSNMIG